MKREIIISLRNERMEIMQYKITGENFPVVTFSLNQGEKLISESGGMSWMTPEMKMETTTGGGVLKGLGRAFSGDSFFINHYTAQADNQMIAFASSFPGKILPVTLDGTNEIIAQKRAFLVATEGVDISMHFNRRIGSGFFGGEGFILQKFSGKGEAFLEIDGATVEYNLGTGEKLLIDQAHLAAMDATVTFTLEKVKGVKNIFFGGEGLFLGSLIGPGRVWIQTMPFRKLALSIYAGMPRK